MKYNITIEFYKFTQSSEFREKMNEHNITIELYKLMQ